MKGKVITLIPSLFGGGAEKFVADSSSKLSDKYDHEILLYNYREDKYDYTAQLTDLDIPRRKGVLGKIFRHYDIYKKISAFKKRQMPKVTISHMLMANILNILTKKKDKTICVLHGEWSVKTGSSKWLDALVKRYYSKADMIVSVSHYIDTMFQEYYRLNVPHEVAYIGVNIEAANSKALEKINYSLPSKYLVYVAGFRPVKNHILLIDHLEEFLKETEISLVLVGDGELRTSIEEKIRTLGLSEKIILTGNLQNPYPIIKNAKLSLQVSSSESFSLVIVESMALGVPVVATDCGGPREIIDPDWILKRHTPLVTNYGVLISNPCDWKENELVSEIEKILDNTEIYNTISNNGITRANEFSLTNAESKYIKIIDSLMS